MNYKKIYMQIINRAILENRKKQGNIYYENHHVIPKCIGGLNNNENLALLTAREHFIAHWLLTKIYPNNNKIIFAFNCFSYKLNGAKNNLGQLDNYSTSKNYEYARQKVVNLLKGKPCSVQLRNSLINTVYINNGIENKRIPKNNLEEYLSKGWKTGRKKFKRKSPSIETRKKISKSNMGKTFSANTIKKWLDFAKENPHCWISKNNISKQIFLKDLESYLKDGWVRGRYSLRTKPIGKAYVEYKDVCIEIDLFDKELYLSYGWKETDYTYFKNYNANSNIVFGIGSYTYNMNSRDTFGFALKSTYAIKDGKEIFLFKNPITDDGEKKSQKGQVQVFKGENGKLTYIDGLNSKTPRYENWLLPLFENGELLRETSLNEIRNRVKRYKIIET